MAGTGREFTKVLTYNGSAYSDVTLEAQSPGGTAFSILEATTHFLYLGLDSKFDMAIFDLAIVGELGSTKWEYLKTDTWTEFIPASARFARDPDDSEGTQYSFDKDGVELFPNNLLSDWVTVAISGSTLYWVRVSSPVSVTIAPTVKQIQCRPIAVYVTSKQVFELLQLKNVTNTTDFTTATVPTKATVDEFIHEAQAYVDMNTRKSWRPNIIFEEYQQFNLNGIKLDVPDAYKCLALKIWTGSTWELKAQGRQADYFLVQDTGMIQFARYFLLPARLSSYGATQFGGGEFAMPVKITYLAGKDVNTDMRQGGIIADITKKMAAMEIMRTADFGNTVVSGMDRVSAESKMQQWQEEVADRLDGLRAFEVF
jgi:hypothetical protein